MEGLSPCRLSRCVQNSHCVFKKSADPQVRRAGRLSNTSCQEGEKGSLGRCSGGWGLRFPSVTLGLTGHAFLRIFATLPADWPPPAPNGAGARGTGSRARFRGLFWGPKWVPKAAFGVMELIQNQFRYHTLVNARTEKQSEADFRTACETSLGTCRRPILFGVGGSGRSPLESADPEGAGGVWVSFEIRGVLRGLS